MLTDQHQLRNVLLVQCKHKYMSLLSAMLARIIGTDVRYHMLSYWDVSDVLAFLNS